MFLFLPVLNVSLRFHLHIQIFLSISDYAQPYIAMRSDRIICILRSIVYLILAFHYSIQFISHD